MSNLTTCPYCAAGGQIVDYSLKWSDERFDNYRIMSCPQCPVSYCDPFPDDETLTRLYNSIQYQDADRKGGDPTSLDESEISSLVQRESIFVDKYAAHLPQPGRVLDVGAGWGLLLKNFKDRGWDAHGIELSQVQAEFARERLGIPIHQASVDEIEALGLPTFDLIVMRHTLEHFRDPRQTLSSLWKRMSTDGRLIVEVPNYQSYDRKAFGKDWPAFGPWHLWYFSRESLSRIFHDTGFEPIEFNQFMSERVFGMSKSSAARVMRGLIKRVGGADLFSGRSIGVIARKSTSPGMREDV